MRKLLILFALLYSATSFAQLSPPAQDTFPWFVNYRLPTRVVGTKAPNSIFVMDSTQTKLRAIPTDSIPLFIPIDSSVVTFDNDSLFTLGGDTITRSQLLGYKEYVALLTQSGTDAPVATVLYNDLGGAVVWTYQGVGEYVGTLTAAFTVNKTVPGEYDMTQGWDIPGNQEGSVIQLRRTTANTVFLTAGLVDGTPQNVFAGVVVKIRVYN